MGASYVDMTQKIGINDDLSRLCEQPYGGSRQRYSIFLDNEYFIESIFLRKYVANEQAELGGPHSRFKLNSVMLPESMKIR